MKLKDWGAFWLLATVWGTSFLWIKIAVQEVGPVTLVAFRVLFGLLFGLIVILAVVTRFYKLEPRVMSHDETSHVYFSWLLYKGQGYAHDPVTHGPMQFHLVALSYFLFGDSDFSSRVPDATVSVVMEAGALFGSRRYLGRSGALIAGLLMPYRWKGDWYRTARLPRGLRRSLWRMRQAFHIEPRNAGLRNTGCSVWWHRPLSASEIRQLLGQHWTPPGVKLPGDAIDTVAAASIIRITGGNFRLLNRLLTQVERILEINALPLVTKQVVEAARENLVILQA